MPKLVIAGTGRSGTQYLSQLFTNLGIKTGHQSVFGVDGFQGWQDYQGDSSFAATAYPKEVPEDAYIFHAMKAPLSNLKAQLSYHYDEETKRGFWDCKESKFDAHFEFLRRECPEIFGANDSMGRAIRFLYAWSVRTYRTFKKRRYYTIARLEHLEIGDIQRALDHCGLNILDEEIEAVLESLGTDVGARHGYCDYLTWDDIDDHEDGHLLRDLKISFALGET
jgi:hypothetical protein